MPAPPSAFRFDPIGEPDLPLLHAWLRRPHVAEWWGPAESMAELRADYVATAAAPDATRAFIVRLDGAPVGFVQAYVAKGSGGGWWEDETDPGVRGIDQFLADPGALGQGLGRSMIRAFVQRLFEDPAVTAVQTDPRPDNVRAIRCYRAVGFHEQGRVTTPDGPALLMRCTRDTLAAAQPPGTD